MDLMEGDSFDCLPWEIPRYNTSRESVKKYLDRPYATNHIPTTVRKTSVYFSIVPSENERIWKRGDIIRFHSAYHHQEKWQEWFIQEEDKKFLKRNRDIPQYAARQYGIVLARYRWTKTKWHGTYRDYGTIIMILTGPAIGYVRKFYIKTPFQKKAEFPYSRINLPVNVADLITEVHEKNKYKMDSYKDRNKFLEILYRKFNPKENINE